MVDNSIMEKDEINVQNIIDAAKKLLQQYGLKKTTMEDIARAAGKGKSTLYYYFKSKEEIFDEVIKQEMDDFFHSVKNAVDLQTDPVEKLKTYLVVKINTLKDKANLYRFTIETHHVEISNQFTVLRDRYDHQETELIASILKLGKQQGVLKFSDEMEVEMVADLLLSCERGIEMEILTKNKFGILADKADLLVGILVKGLS